MERNPLTLLLGGAGCQGVSRLRWFSGIALAVCLLLPMGSCGDTPQYIVREVNLNPLTWPWVLAFLWPIPVWQFRRSTSSDRIRALLFFFELPALFGSLYAVSSFSILTRPLIGCYVGWSALALHAFAWAAEARNQLAKARRRTRHRI